MYVRSQRMDSLLCVNVYTVMDYFALCVHTFVLLKVIACSEHVFM